MNKKRVESYLEIFLLGDFFFQTPVPLYYLIFAAFIETYRNYNLSFHVICARFCSSYACWVGGV